MLDSPAKLSYLLIPWTSLALRAIETHDKYRKEIYYINHNYCIALIFSGL